MASNEDYKQVISEIIKKQITILGPDVALLKARQIEGLKIDEHGGVVSISGEYQEVLQKLIDRYIELSGEIVKNILSPVFAKYPTIDVKIK